MFEEQECLKETWMFSLGCWNNPELVRLGLHFFFKRKNGTLGCLLWDWWHPSLWQAHDTQGYLVLCSWLSYTTPRINTRQAGNKGADYCAQDFRIKKENHPGGDVSFWKAYLPHVTSMEGASEDLWLLCSCFLNKVYSLTDAFWRVSKALRFNDLLKELTKFRKPVIFMIMVCYKKRNKLKSAKIKGAYGTIQETPGTSFPLFFPNGAIWWCLILPAMICDMCRVLWTRDAYLSLGVQGFYWQSVT